MICFENEGEGVYDVFFFKVNISFGIVKDWGKISQYDLGFRMF